MHYESERLRKHIDVMYEKYEDVDDAIAAINLDTDQWLLKAIIGHLVDSAANDYQRFSRLQETEVLAFPGYDYNWIKIVNYHACPFIKVLEPWKQYNLLSGHIIANIDEKKNANKWLADGKPISLDLLVKDYIGHMEKQIAHLHARSNAICGENGP